MARTENIKFELTPEQADMVCACFGKKADDLEDFKIAELLDKIIDDYYYTVLDNVY